MDGSDPNARLNQIATLWTVVRLANNDSGEAGRQARAALLERYDGAIRRYLVGVLRDPAAAQDLAQEFAYRFLHGDLKGADRERGRFRDFVKGVLFHLVADYHNRRKRQPGQLPEKVPEPADECSLAAERDEAFRVSWRDELLARTWKALQAQEEHTGQLYFTVLRFRADHPDLNSTAMAEKLSERLGKPLNAPAVRKTLERARDRFAELLLDEIGQAIENPSREALEDELSELGLLEHCRSALAARGG